jgi:hypothetical protein
MLRARIARNASRQNGVVRGINSAAYRQRAERHLLQRRRQRRQRWHRAAMVIW